MYDWLSDSLNNSGTVVTANRRLARALGEHFAAEQLAVGKKAWRSSDIVVWQDWLVSLSNNAINPEDLPTRINAQQSQVLWERCLQREVGDGPNLRTLVRLSRETRQRLADWQVSISDVARSALSEDHRVFASVLGRYLAILERENWVDEAGLGTLVLQLISDQRIELSHRYTFVGFERQRPIMTAIHDAMIDAGITVTTAPVAEPKDQCSLKYFDNSAAELRSAGAWARQQINRNPEARIAIIANGLERNTEIIVRQVREGATPGWQHGHQSLYNAVNVSFGRRLSDFPAIAVALLLLRWLVGELSSTDVGMLLRSPLLGEETASRSRFELRLRQLPSRRWTPSMITAELRSQGDGENAGDWAARLAAFSKRRRELPKSAAPAEWAVLIDDVLRSFAWPGHDSLDSADFQLINRWRELLNEYARLGLVSSTMSPRAAIARLDTMACDIVFQPESVNARIHLMGSLEASGLRFDGTWVSGVTTANWPPAGAPSALVSRRLQEEHGMPDCTPADTMRYAQRVLGSLVASGDCVVCSYSLTEDDAEQTVSDLLTPLLSGIPASPADSGLYAATLLDNVVAITVQDRVPPVAAGEKISGGAGTIQRQIRDPVTAFIHGRMGARLIYPQAIGIPASMRGNLIHDALYKLYIDLPASDVIRSWQGEELAARVEAAVDFAFSRHERNTDAVLQQLLLLERQRISGLLHEFVAVDGNRGKFMVSGVEGTFEFVAGNIRLPLRFDRIDTFDNGEIAILDYKTGKTKQLVGRDQEAQEIQLFVYAFAADAVVSALALVNVDSREIAFDGVGRGYANVDDWPDLLRRVKEQITTACNELAGGDVRINIEQGIVTARSLNLLTRYTELRHDNG